MPDKLMQWMPIDTAPKDGSKVLIHQAGSVVIARFVESLGVWRTDDHDDYAMFFECDPSHWMALPDPPKEDDTCEVCGALRPCLAHGYGEPHEKKESDNA